MNDFPTRLRMMRKAQELNQKQLADLVGITQTFISDLESGKRNPSVEVLGKLCDALRCSADYLLSVPPANTLSKLEQPRLPGALTPEILAMVEERNISESELKTAIRVASVMRDADDGSG